MSDAPRILLIDEDKVVAARVATVLNRSGFFCRYVGDRKKALAGLRQVKPDLLVMVAELRSEQTSELLSALGADVAAAHQPIALLCQNTREDRFVGNLRTGIVALLPRPFEPGTHVRALEELITGLPRRNGLISGKGDSSELVALVEHLRRTQRSGALRIDPRGPNEGEALFARGVLKSARYGALKDMEALTKLVALRGAAFSFSEVGSEPGGGEIVIPVEELVVEEEAYVISAAAPDAEAFEIPLEPAPMEDEPLAPVPAPAVAAKPAPTGPRIPLLLVDDDESLCQMFSLLFRKHGYDVTVARDGVEGHERALAASFGAVVADLNMPRLDGWGMLRLLRDDLRTRELPVAFLSCHDDYRESLRALDAGAQAYYSKSTRLEALVRHVGELLAPREHLRAALASPGPVPVNLGVVGPQWLLTQLSSAERSGALVAKDSWASYELFVQNGQPVHAHALSGKHRAEGEKAFNAFIASRGATGTFTPGDGGATRTLEGPLPALLEKATQTLNANEARLKEHLLVRATDIQVNPELYSLYTQVGPKQWLEAARLLCEEKLPPREVLARVEISPIEVEETLRDLVRRGVLSLTV